MAAYIEIAKKKQAQREALIPNEWKLDDSKLPGPEVTDVHDFASTCGMLTPKEVEIINTPARKLVEKMLAKELKSYDATLAFCKSATIAHQVVNPLTEILFDKALERAKEIDDTYEKTGIPVGSLHGLPMSIKDNFNIKGYDAVIGFASFAFKPAKANSVLVDILNEAGAVIYCKTNVPPGMLRSESVNNTFGRTLNPYQRNTAAGGSSGGEAALVAMRGAPVGIGTDIGGSIRIPSAFSSVFGLKPSSGRIPLFGGVNAMPGQEALSSIAGPMSSDLDSLDLLCKAIIDSKPWLRDPKCLPIPWKQDVEIPQKLCIGLIESDNIVTPTPPVQYALKKVVEILKSQGHTIIPIKETPNEKMYEFQTDLFTPAGSYHLDDCISSTGEDWAPEMAWLKGREQLKASEMWALQYRRNNWVKEEVLDMWENTRTKTPTKKPIDCILSPASVFAAPPHEKHTHIVYTSPWNVADFSAGTFPVTRVTPENSKVSPDFVPKGDVEKKIYANYDPSEIQGAPVSLQIICHRYEDEKTIKILKFMSDLVKENSNKI